jgi:hypothetical protein
MMTIPDIAGTGATVQIVLPNPARWVQFALTGSGTARIGGSCAANGSTTGFPSAATSTQGVPVVAGNNAGFMAPFMGQFSFYQATEFSAYIPSGATLSVAAKE